ncbi:hypothetical protein HJC23_000711 [Cyclotella cryptica]|uniref:Cyclin N-terminal domain-containing protein n=1 Tax=Cyclotella cryptica TaxID=29204 RepID=A0ABD3Q9F4_9STRA|eukprot:CCRYP_007397-RA/>CCRYP_007397-RA protein AED:0.04 eAED:-0.04 QI:0/-1/0/1/-1/1/1/0/326
MDLRAPLPPQHLKTNGVFDMSTSRRSEHERTTRHLLSRMFISSQLMELGSEARFTGLVLFHRYVRHFYGLVEEQRKKRKIDKTELEFTDELKQIRQHLGQVAAACSFLGCKMSEEPRRIRDVINLSSVLGFSDWDESMDINRVYHWSEAIEVHESVSPPPLDEKYWTTKEEIVSTEQLVLRMLQFDALVCHPHRCVLIVMETLGFGTGPKKNDQNDVDGNKCIDGTKEITFLTPEQSDQVIMDAWRILNEASLDATGGALMYPVIVLACAAIAVAADGITFHPSRPGEGDGRKPQVSLPQDWWRALDVRTDEIEAAMISLRKIVES